MNKEDETQKAEGRVSPEPREETKHRQEKDGERERWRQTKTLRPEPCLKIGPDT